MRSRFIEEQHIGLLRERHRQQRALTLAAGERIDRPACQGAEVELAHRSSHRDPIGLAGAPEQAQTRGPAETDDFADAEREQRVEHLGHDRDAPRDAPAIESA